MLGHVALALALAPARVSVVRLAGYADRLGRLSVTCVDACNQSLHTGGYEFSKVCVRELYLFRDIRLYLSDR